MNDDKPHEYVPHEWRDIAVGTRDECRERLDAAQAEANNMAEALRQVNARLAEVTAAKEFWERQCDIAAKDHRVEMGNMGRERNAALDALAKTQAALSAARQSRKRAVWAAHRYRDGEAALLGVIETIGGERDEWKSAAEARSDCCIELDAAERALFDLRARVAELEHERALSQQMREDDGR